MRRVSVLLIAGAAVFAGCGPSTPNTPFAQALLAAVKADPRLHVGPKYCDDCSVGLSHIVRSRSNPAVVAATVDLTYNYMPEDGFRVILEFTAGRWIALGAAGGPCARVASVTRLPVTVVSEVKGCSLHH